MGAASAVSSSLTQTPKLLSGNKPVPEDLSEQNATLFGFCCVVYSFLHLFFYQLPLLWCCFWGEKPQQNLYHASHFCLSWRLATLWDTGLVPPKGQTTGKKEDRAVSVMNAQI